LTFEIDYLGRLAAFGINNRQPFFVLSGMF